MILEKKVVEILHKEMPKLEKHIKWDGMYDHIAEKIVKSIKDTLFE
tara:strand:- start:788 stop:925 length:138 start_codon:yes stop_codon:yes gene_type:complete